MKGYAFLCRITIFTELPQNFLMTGLPHIPLTENRPFSQECRLVFSRFLDLRGSLGNVKVKPTTKTCFSHEKKRLAPSIYLAKFC